MPYRSALLKRYKLAPKLEQVKSEILKANLNQDLLKAVYVPFLKLSSITLEERISYKELIYLNTYLQAFYDEMQRRNEPITEAVVFEILYRVNYNSSDLFFYKTSLFNAQVALKESIPEKIDFLYHCLKLVSQCQCKVNIAFDPALPSLKDQLTGWLEEEINYLNKKLLLQNRTQTQNLFSEEEKAKIDYGLTVAQLALFYRLQADVGIIKHKAPGEIFAHISNNCRSQNTSEISQSSVKNKYYSIDTPSIQVVKDKVIEMLNQLKSL